MDIAKKRNSPKFSDTPMRCPRGESFDVAGRCVQTFT